MDITKRNRFLKKLNNNRLLDEIDREAIREGILLQNLKSYQKTANRVLDVLFRGRPE